MLACSPRFLWEPAAGAGGRAALRLLSRAGGRGTIPPASGGGGRGPRGLRAGWGGGWGGLRRGLPAPPLGGGPRFPTLAPPWRARAVGVAGPPPLPSLSGQWSWGGHGGRGLHTVLVRRRAPPPGLVRAPLRRASVGSPVSRDPRGSRRLGALGRAVCSSSRIPPPRVAVPSPGGGRPLGSGRAEGRSCGPQAGGGGVRGGGGGEGGPPSRPLSPRPVGRRPAICCLRRAPPGYTRAVGVAGRPRASGAARLAANGSVRRGGGGQGGGTPPPWFGPPSSPCRPLKGPLRLRRPGRHRSAGGRQRAGRAGAYLGHGAPAPRVQRPLRGGCGHLGFYEVPESRN